MKKIIQAAFLIMIAAFAILAAANSYPSRLKKNVRQGTKELHMDTGGTFGCRHSPDEFIYQPNH